MTKHNFTTFEEYLFSVRDLSQNVLRPAEKRLTREGGIPDDLTNALKDIGLFGISIPKEFGGFGFTMEQQVRLTFEFCQASCVFRSRFSTTIGLTSQAILDFATEEQKNKYLPKMASGTCTGAFALTETEAGSDASALTTTAKKTGNKGWLINGEKRYITNAPQADVFLVMARTDENSSGSRGISAFLVDADRPGITVGEPPEMLGNEGSHACYVWLDDCEVPHDCL